MNWLSLLGLEAWAARWRATVIEGAIAVEDRLELARLEWAQQRARLQWLLVLGIAAGALTVVVALLLSMAVLVHFWDTPYRATTGWLIALAWLLVWMVLVWKLVRIAQASHQGFALTRRELAQDWQDLKERL